MSRYIDYDKARAERKVKRLVIHLFDKDWQLPATLPAAAVLKVIRYKMDDRDHTDLTVAEIIDLAVDLVPKKTLDAWLAEGMEISELGDLIMQIFGAYSEKGDAEGEMKAPAATGAPDSYSPDGPSLKPISPGNTDSI